jgi:phosphohistidine phosphatase
MRTLLVLRHAKSSWAESGQSDHLRPLNGRGERDAPRVGDVLRERRWVPEVIVSSDAVRAKMTAEAAARTAGYAGTIRFDHGLYLAGPGDIIELLHGVEDTARSVMIVGHNPGLEELVSQLTGEPASLATATLVRIVLPIDRWRDLDQHTAGSLADSWQPND